MKIGVALKIDVSKIEKARLFQGKKGIYLDGQVFIDIDQPDKYDNNGMITQVVSKEEREAGTQGPILGNCRIFWRGESQQGQQQNYQSSQAQQTPQDDGFGDEDIPF
jgi:hypothetical protein